MCVYERIFIFKKQSALTSGLLSALILWCCKFLKFLLSCKAEVWFMNASLKR